MSDKSDGAAEADRSEAQEIANYFLDAVVKPFRRNRVLHRLQVLSKQGKHPVATVGSKQRQRRVGCRRLSQAPLYVDDSSDTGVLDVRAKARRLHHQLPGGLGLIIVDYLQLMRP